MSSEKDIDYVMGLMPKHDNDDELHSEVDEADFGFLDADRETMEREAAEAARAAAAADEPESTELVPTSYDDTLAFGETLLGLNNSAGSMTMNELIRGLQALQRADPDAGNMEVKLDVYGVPSTINVKRDKRSGKKYVSIG